jgi:hypothetical protein
MDIGAKVPGWTARFSIAEWPMIAYIAWRRCVTVPVCGLPPGRSTNAGDE